MYATSHLTQPNQRKVTYFCCAVLPPSRTSQGSSDPKTKTEHDAEWKGGSYGSVRVWNDVRIHRTAGGKLPSGKERQLQQFCMQKKLRTHLRIQPVHVIVCVFDKVVSIVRYDHELHSINSSDLHSVVWSCRIRNLNRCRHLPYPIRLVCCR